MLKHGGRLLEAAEYYQIPLKQWLDLSTGINPNGYPIPHIPNDIWLRLPEEQDNLLATAQNYYQCPAILPVAGSQAAIQALPFLRKPGLTGLVAPSYAEHAYAWKKAGHRLRTLLPNEIDANIQHLDNLVLVNPNNPSGILFSKQQCLAWLKELNKRNGWLIIDEAFIDCTPELSLSTLSPQKGLIILRSIGKFFGLAGIRSGFVLAEPTILDALNEQLGPWTISNPSRLVTAHALQNKAWQQQTRLQLQHQSQRLKELLSGYALAPTGSNALFQWIETNHAQAIHQNLAQQAVFTRLFNQPHSLRFGLPKTEQDWQQLELALSNL
ncbi:MAG: threonine-phosphate decarboxylase CobD [Methyloprofundus sp.]|nr:threonine-phosphate decarboxylase CobD [Methyloprofundus sp.]